ncbi:MAG: ferrous iron transporter B, partial [Planctomycetales bacterium]|nr:ferrous iron transporter B [Planctomycetales bacterium]
VIGGVGGVIVFLPQICILFFFISLLEDSGYLARAAFVMERVMRVVGLPGKAFVPMLSAHACAIPGIMAARVIDSWRDRLVTILVLPMLTCSARLPVYTMVAALLFADSPGLAAVMFFAAYLLGIVAALLTAFMLKHTILKGEVSPLVLELPPYRRPSLRNALLNVFDRATVFVRRAGTVILLISVGLWALSNYPKLPEDSLANEVTSTKLPVEPMADSSTDNETPSDQAERMEAQERLAYSAAGRVGRVLEPVFAPLGFDWKINVGVVSSFAAREVIVSTLSIIYGVGEDSETLTETLQHQQRPDGSPVYSRATCFSLLVFYVLAMQCLPTQVVTSRETGSWRWAILQLVYMTALAYGAALVTFQVTTWLG